MVLAPDDPLPRPRGSPIAATDLPQETAIGRFMFLKNEP